MAEFVELRLEEMLPELEQTERVGLLSPEEVRTIIKRRREFEYRIQRRTKKKEDYLKYIQYEMSLYKLLKLRRKKGSYSFKKDEIDHAISNRIGALFRFCVFRFQNDLKLWLSYIDFCKQVQWGNKISKIFVRMLAVHNDKPYLWLMAAKWEFEENTSAENARAVLLRGLQFLPDSKELYLESFRLELLFVDRLLKRRNVLGIQDKELNPETEDQVLQGRLAEVVYDTAVEKIPESHFVVQFLSIAKVFEFGKWLEEKIMSDLIEKYPTDEHTWDTLARRELEGRGDQTEITTGQSQETMDVDDPKPARKIPKFSVRLEKCCETYEKGLEIINTPKLSTLYLATLLELRNSGKHLQTVIPKLLEIFELMDEKEHLTESLYETWLSLSKDLKKWDSLGSIAESATQRFPKNTKFWIERLESEFGQKTNDHPTDLFVIDTGSLSAVDPLKETVVEKRARDSDSEDSDSEAENVTEDIPSVFYDAIKALGDTEEAIPIWAYVSKWLVSKGRKVQTAVQKLFEESLTRKPIISRLLHVTFLEWTANAKGIDNARHLYSRLAVEPPFSLEFHRKMVELEVAEPVPSLINIRRAFEFACDQFGKKDSKIWLDYIRFERVHGDAMKVPNIHRRAKAMLDASLVNSFLNEFVLLSTGVKN